MTKDRASLVETIFNDALGLPVAQRVAYVKRVSGADPVVLEEVLSLLEATEDAEGYLASLASRIGAPHGAVRHEEVRLDGQRVGPYRLVRELGRGSMGTVYLGEREEGGFQQRVAVKLLRRGLDTDDILARFRTERQILATLNHPNIAHLIDGGATEDGRPYLVTELVEGLPITGYSDHHGCTIPERLRLFVQIARAVQHAHRNLILHRDIKPSNILVSEDGVPKLLDFGIAKLLDSSLAEGLSQPTRTGMQPLTPEYASPEQLRGEPATTASDTYQLGILLYRLLAGRRPYPARGSTRAQIEEGIGDLLPPPSRVALGLDLGAEGDGGPAPSEIARSRGTDVRGLRASLRGDLDTIVLKSVRRDPERRYASPGELADDIERYMEGRPVAARPDTLGYRVRRFASRNPAAVGLAALAVVALAGYVGTLRVHAVTLEREWDRAETALERAESEAAKASEVTGFISRLFEDADPANARGADLTVREVLDRGIGRREGLPQDPDARAELLSVMVRIYGALGLHGPSLEPALEALALRRQVHGEAHESVVHGLRLVGAALHGLADYPGAEAAYREALAVGIGLQELDPVVMAATLEDLGAILRWTGRWIEADEALREASEIRWYQALDERDMVGYWMARSLLAGYEYDFATALLASREEVKARRRRDGDDHPGLVDALYRIVPFLFSSGDSAGYESAIEEGLALSLEVFGEDHPSTARGLIRRGGILRRRGDRPGGDSAIHEGIGILRRTLGEDHPEVATALQTLAQGQEPGEAEPILLEVLRIHQLQGRNSPHVAGALGRLAYLALVGGDLDLAEARFREALLHPIRDSAPPSGHWGGLAMVLHRKGDLEGAEEIYRNVLAMQWLPRAEHLRADWMISLGSVLLDQGDLDGAEELLLEGIEISKEILGENSHIAQRGLRHLDRLSELRGAAEPPRR